MGRRIQDYWENSGCGKELLFRGGSNIQDQVGQGSEQPDLVSSVPASVQGRFKHSRPGWTGL